MDLVKLSQATKFYINTSFDLTISKSDFILISGENGSGKTTLIHLVLGFIMPDQGTVTSKKLKIGYLPEKAMLPQFVKVSHYLETLARLKKGVIDYQLIHRFNLPFYKSIHELSKGNFQKLALISTFLGKPDLVILDEPLSGLDEESSAHLITYMEEKRHEGMSFMVSTHQPERFKKLASQIVML